MQELKLNNPFNRINPFRLVNTNQEYGQLSSSNSTNDFQKIFPSNYNKICKQDKVFNYSLAKVNSYPINFQKFAKQNDTKQGKIKNDCFSKNKNQKTMQNPFYRRFLLNNSHQMEERFVNQITLTKLSQKGYKQEVCPESIKIEFSQSVSSSRNSKNSKEIEPVAKTNRVSFRNSVSQLNQNLNIKNEIQKKSHRKIGKQTSYETERIIVKGKEYFWNNIGLF